MGSTDSGELYTTSFAFFEALIEAGITHVFVNLGSDHPSIIEAIVKGQQEKPDVFPRIITCPNEMVALSMADGMARLTNKPQCVIIHVDVGTQALAAAVHDASVGRAPVLIFAGLSPYTLEGEYRGSRTEYIHWLQDVPDQKQIIAQYCRYTGEIKAGRNVKQMVNRALQFAMSDPQGPVYLYGAREPMEEDITPYYLDQSHWQPVGPGALTDDAVEMIGKHLLQAKMPLMVVGYTGRKAASVTAAVKLADTIPGLRVLDTGICDMCFPSDHPAWLGARYGVHEFIEKADFILVVDCDVPWIPTRCKPRKDAKIVHIDADVLKQMIPVAYIPAFARYKADCVVALSQINKFLQGQNEHIATLQDQHKAQGVEREKEYRALRDWIKEQAALSQGVTSKQIHTNWLMAEVRKAVPEDTIFVVEAVTNTTQVHDQVAPILPKSYINCGGGGLGWSGGGALGVKLASDFENRDTSIKNSTGSGKGKFVCQIVGDGCYMFSVPSSVYWISQRYQIPILTIVLNNKGWNAPRQSLLLVHPHGHGSKVSNQDIHISFEPTPDFSGIAKAASAGKCWAGAVGTVDELLKSLPEAIKAVESGVSAVLDVKLNQEVKQAGTPTMEEASQVG